VVLPIEPAEGMAPELLAPALGNSESPAPRVLPGV
jgi:hypothetical protein